MRELDWRGLAPNLRDALDGKLEGLYGGADAGDVFNALDLEKQRALLIFARRLSELNLWREVERVTNVYGEGGVGLEFIAAPALKSKLSRSTRFTSRFAAHGDTAEGFYELKRAKAALHFLRARRRKREWSVHFDLHAPLARPSSLLLHLWHEKLRARTPHTEEIADALGYDLSR
ncbi:MAG: hypothetical protein QOE33_1654 [Acidobacteriota bacterium]|nr:hypothetical protein [Acidobacteriota bacterium]